MKRADKAALERIAMILGDYDNEMKNYVPPQNDDQNKPGKGTVLFAAMFNID